MLAFITNLMFREEVLANRGPSIAITFSCFVETLLCVLLCLQTGYTYNGIILLSLACTFPVVEKTYQKVTFISLLILLYVICEYDLLSQYAKIVSFDTYVSYFPATVRSNIYTFKSVLTSVNILVFFVYMYFWVQIKISENLKINQLYEQQYHMNEELKLANIQMKHYIEKSEVAALTQERNRLAREIHDILGHSLTAITLGLEACAKSIEDTEWLKNQLKILSETSNQALVEVRRSVKKLRVDSIEKLSFYPAVLKLCANITSLTNTIVNFEAPDYTEFSPTLEDMLYRIIQESITNSVRHGKAPRIDIRLDNKDGYVLLTIKDNGLGCDDMKLGSGLSGIRERVTSMGGELSFDLSQGFTISLSIPLEEKRDAIG
ncbi:MAG: sensor histidine kinase [Christensenellaceae bacterium]|nr:sensor histidine kinase [Christensenellaceae bacterium]